MIYVTGRTLVYATTLRDYGGWWNHYDKRWEFTRLSKNNLRHIKSLVGVIVTETATPPIPCEPIRIGDDMTYCGEFASPSDVFGGFSSLAAFANHVESLVCPENEGGLCDIGWTATPEYTGTKNMREALSIAHNGWTDGLGLAASLLLPEPIVKRRARSVAGGSVNVGRMLSGAPNHMMKRAKLPGKRVITLFVETVMWEGIKADVALLRVIAIAAIVDRLEQKGYSCNIIAVYSSSTITGDSFHQVTVNIKNAGERLNIADMSFAFGHPSFGRRLVYAHHGSIARCGLTREWRGHIDEAFTDKHQPPRNSYYIPRLIDNEYDIWKIIKQISPIDIMKE